jgi:tetraacyldisaccharide 4'-kinase
VSALTSLLRPFSVLYGGVARARNWLFDKKMIVSESFEIPIIGIGNLSAGGTGKTPMAEYLLRMLLEAGHTPALLSRGYGRETKGYQVVKPYSNARQVGDEPYQIKRKFQPVTVVVCEDRTEGVRRIMQSFPEVDVIVLDDGFQHRRLNQGFSILLTTAGKPYFLDKLLPAGRLREPQEGKIRADVIIMTKCETYPDPDKKKQLTAKLAPGPGQPVYFTCISYSSLFKVGFDGREEEQFPIENLKGYDVLLFTGIASPEPMAKFLEDQKMNYELVRFADHHTYTPADIKKIHLKWAGMHQMNKLLLTTEKDWRRLEHTPEAELLRGMPLFFLPIEVEWDEEEKRSFDQKILDYVSANKRVGSVDKGQDRVQP